MNTTPILSILTPTIPGREKQLAKLQHKIEQQSKGIAVEHLVFCDNKKRSIGAKRQALLDIARGKYVAFVDDDDDILIGYVAQILKAAKSSPDVITFEQKAIYNGQESRVVFKLGQQNGPFTQGGVTKRNAWHVCAWRRDRVKDCLFAERNYGEDWAWCAQAVTRARNSTHIPITLHKYVHDAQTTAAPEPHG